MTDGPDVSRLAPSDAVVAMRSYPRRFRGAFTSFEDDESPDDLVRRPGPDNLSALDHADRAARTFSLLGRALNSVLVEESPVLAPAVANEEEHNPAPPGAPPTSMTATLDLVTLEANAVADLAERVPAEDWGRIGTIAGSGHQVRALDMLREAVRSGSVHLRAAQEAIDSARRQPS
jgi:hypothetical protein